MSYTTPREVNVRPLGSPEELERRRRRAIELLRQGNGPGVVGRMLGVNRRSVRRWQALFRRKGSAALTARPASGRPPRLAERQKRKLERTLLRGAQAAGYETDLWTCPRVAEVIDRRFGIRYHVDHVCRLLHDLGWSPQKPQRKAVQRDEVAIRRWIKEQWTAIKKKRPA